MSASLLDRVDWDDVCLLTSVVKRLVDPTTMTPWVMKNHAPFTLSNVKRSPLNPYPFPDKLADALTWGRREHLGRVRWLMEHYGEWEQEAISINVEESCYWPLTDGNHRFAAIILLRKRYVCCSCGGPVAILETMFGDAINYKKSRLLPIGG